MRRKPPPRPEKRLWSSSCSNASEASETSERAFRRRLPGVRGRVLAIALLLAAAASLTPGAPGGAQAFGAPELTCSRSYDLVKSLLKRHISFRSLNPELRERAIACSYAALRTYFRSLR